MGSVTIRSGGRLKSVVTRDSAGRELARFSTSSSLPVSRSSKSSQSSPFGLGDAVEVVAKPIARLVDRVAGTHLAGCGGCARRRALLNRLVPDLKKMGRPGRHERPARLER